jgi:hypothetical protein
MADAQARTFEMGLAMAGAISAGAYSGGVFDFLLQALDEWEKAKANNVPDIPNHQVVIKVLSGASAGAITGAIGAVAFAGGLKPQKFDAPAPRQQKYRCTLPTLYDAWVVKPRLVGARAGDADLLSLEDLKPQGSAGDGKPAADLISAVAALFPALINQARFKPSELTEAAAANVYSRFLIAPHRQLPKTAKEELYAIACGLLGGFGGFLDEEFRKHDFQLGRRNCQRFLRDVFALPADNAIIKGWPANAKTNVQFQTVTPTDGAPMFCIIPLMGSASDMEAEVVLPPWPRMNQADFDTLQVRIKARLEALAPILIERQTASRTLRTVLKIAAASSTSRILDFVKFYILSDMVRRDQIAGWELSDEATDPYQSQDVRQVLAELAHPSYDFRTVGGISRATGLKSQDIDQILSFLQKQAGKPYLVWQSAQPDNSPIYTLASRKPSAIWQWPIIRSIGDLIAAPVVN